jgi:hypothetical protein
MMRSIQTRRKPTLRKSIKRSVTEYSFKCKPVAFAVEIAGRVSGVLSETLRNYSAVAVKAVCAAGAEGLVMTGTGNAILCTQYP